jgi:hypothetical protein
VELLPAAADAKDEGILDRLERGGRVGGRGLESSDQWTAWYFVVRRIWKQDTSTDAGGGELSTAREKNWEGAKWGEANDAVTCHTL